ncbi:MAG: hypothetical protein ACRD8U_25710, partial [Pyrinomonadaceae bacterium]
MRRSIFLLALLALIPPPCAGQLSGPQSLAGEMRPVKQLPSSSPSSGEIHFEGFEFQQLYVTRHPGSWPIKGEPTKGFRFFVEAELYGEEAIATAKFEAVDEVGNVIQPVLIQRRPDASGRSEFYGVMKVPDRPFRIVISGEGIDERSYRRTYKRLFRPTTRRHSAVVYPPGGPPVDAKKRQRFEAVIQERRDKEEDDLRKNAGKGIVMPRTRVSN